MKNFRKETIINDFNKNLSDIELDGYIVDSPEDLIKDNLPVTQHKNYFPVPEKKPKSRNTKQEMLEKLLTKKLGPEVRQVIDKLVEIAMYDPNIKEYVKDKDGNTKIVSKRYHYYNANTQMQALTLLLKYYYGEPKKEVEVNQNINIEKKVANLTELINSNKERFLN